MDTSIDELAPNREPDTPRKRKAKEPPTTRVSIECGDALKVLARLPEGSVDVIFADVPYGLSGGGSTCKGGRRVKVGKGEWDAPRETNERFLWQCEWLSLARRALKDTGSIWVCGSMHGIYPCGTAVQSLGFRVLNQIVWEKTNPPPNLGCRMFTHSHEVLVWASKSPTAKHYFDYPAMRFANGGKQMKDVWRIGRPAVGELTCGKHPTQKPVELVERCLVASLPHGGLVVDPFAGSGTTAVVVAQSTGTDWRCHAIDKDQEWCDLAQRRVDLASQR